MFFCLLIDIMDIINVHYIIITSTNQFPKSINPLNNKHFVVWYILSTKQKSFTVTILLLSVKHGRLNHPCIINGNLRTHMICQLTSTHIMSAFLTLSCFTPCFNRWKPWCGRDQNNVWLLRKSKSRCMSIVSNLSWEDRWMLS